MDKSSDDSHQSKIILKNSSIGRTVEAFARLLSDCSNVEFGVFSDSSVFSMATDDEKARDILTMASFVNSAYALTPVSRVSTSDVIGPLVKATKVKCTVCDHFVNPDNHESRCRVSLATPEWIKTTSWIGDSLLGLHVRLLLVDTVGVDGDNFVRCTANVRLSQAYDEVSPTVLGASFVATGTSSHNRGTFVEAAYAMSFKYRIELLRWLGLRIPNDFSVIDTSVSMLLFKLLRNGTISVTPNSAVFGYCYMDLLPQDRAEAIALEIGPMPRYGMVKSSILTDKIRGRWYVSHQFDNLYHVSVVPVPGVQPTTAYSSNLGLLDSDRVGAFL